TGASSSRAERSPPDGRNVRGEPLLRLLPGVTVCLAARSKGMVAGRRTLLVPNQTVIHYAPQEPIKLDREADGDNAVLFVMKDDGRREFPDAGADRRGER